MPNYSHAWLTGTAEGFFEVELLDAEGRRQGATMRARIAMLALSQSGEPVNHTQPRPSRLKQGRYASSMIDEPLV